MKILDLENKLEDVENNLLIIYETANALHILLSEGGIKIEQADAILWGITNDVFDSLENVKCLVEEIMEIRGILKSI
ncbi:MAG: hypothetical protein HFG92_12530 [Dorea sp.]|jgi:hypothetical protein|nr:hypothetical protein [Dorea sp.]